MNNYKLLLQYDGTRYAGWQIQENAVTIQQLLTESIRIILKEDVRVTGSGRTDSGVHALGQCANFCTESQVDLYKFRYQLNSVLPDDISVISIEKAHAEFNPRYDAKKRSYIYIISTFKSPFLKNYSWFINRELDLNRLKEISKEFTGRRDFTAFCRKASETENKICDVYNISWIARSGVTIFKIEADRFLHGMVRTVLGTILEAVKKENPSDYIRKVFESRERSEAGEAVPAKGLFLYKVYYDN